MAKWIKTNFPGVRYREHPNRKNGIRRDQYFTIRYKYKGKDREEGLGWATQNWTAAKAYDRLKELKENIKKGEGPQTLHEKRSIEEDRKKTEDDKKQRAIKEAISLKDFFETHYLPVAKANKPKKTWSDEERMFRLWIEPVIGGLPLKQVSPIHLEKIKKILADKGRAASTIIYVLAVIRQVFNFARKMVFYTDENPVGKVKKPKINNKRLRFLTHEEASILLEALKTRSWQVYNMALLSLHTGLRAGEVFSLDWGDVDLQRRLLTLRNTKNGKTRNAFMTDAVLEMFLSLSRLKNNGIVFPSHNGKKIDQVSKTFNIVVKELGLNEGIADKRYKVVWHTLRHTFASWLVESGVDLYRTQKLLGHSSSSMTARYAHLSPTGLQEAMKTLERSIEAGKKQADENVVDLRK